jgi:hypothetical protein
MATYSTNLGLTLIANGDENGTWGTTTNTNLGTLLEQSISGYVTQAVSSGTTTLTIPDGATGVARNMYLELTGTGGGSLVVPAKRKLYFIYNNSSAVITVKVTGLTGVAVPAAAKMALVCDGTDIVNAVSYFASLTLGAALPAASGGTGVTSPSTTGNVLTSNGSAWVSSAPANSGTVTSVGFTGGLISVATATTTPALTVAGTSGGIPYFGSASTWASSAALTQYGIVYGGGAGATPVATAAGTTGQVLTATTGSAPTWATPAAGASGAIVTTTGVTAYTIPAGVTNLKVTIIGGGAGGGSTGGGGGAAATAITFLTGLTPGNTLKVTVGTGGAGGASGGTFNGSDGVDSKLETGTTGTPQTITAVTAGKGFAGLTISSGVGGGLGGTASGGVTANTVLIGGGAAIQYSTTTNSGGNGGASSMGGGGQGVLDNVSAVGTAGLAYGSGGGGGGIYTSGSGGGGDGKQGIVIFEW